MPFISVITPCYNSARTLETTYASLLRQSWTDFEWILIDDASTDGGATHALMRRIAAQAPFPVHLHFLDENFFGSRSVWTGATLAQGAYATILDHDDQLTPAALATVAELLARHGGSPRVAGVAGRCCDERGRFIGAPFAEDCSIVNEAQIRFVQRNTSELLQFTRTELLRTHFSAMRPGYTNGFVWARIAETHDYIFVNDVLRVYDIGLPTSYSNNRQLLVKYPAAKATALRSTILAYRPHLKCHRRYGSQLIGSYLRHTINGGTSFLDAIQGFDRPLQCWCAALYPVAWCKARGWWR